MFQTKLQAIKLQVEYFPDHVDDDRRHLKHALVVLQNPRDQETTPAVGLPVQGSAPGRADARPGKTVKWLESQMA